MGAFSQKQRGDAQPSIMHRNTAEEGRAVVVVVASICTCERQSEGHHSQTAYASARPGSSGLNCMENIDAHPKGLYSPVMSRSII